MEQKSINEQLNLGADELQQLNTQKLIDFMAQIQFNEKALLQQPQSNNSPLTQSQIKLVKQEMILASQ